MTNIQLTEYAERKVEQLTLAIAQSAFTSLRSELESELALAKFALSALQERRKAETADREMLKRLAIIMSGSDAPGEIRALTVTAQSFVDRCKQLAYERDEAKAMFAAQFKNCEEA